MTIDREALQTEFALRVIAGEGSFYLTFAKDDRRQYGVTPGIRFQLNMGQFSEALLFWLTDVVELGSVTDHGSGYTWTVSSRKDCQTLRARIDWHLSTYDSGFTETAKYDAYQRWTEALDIMRPDVALTKDELLELADIRDSINKVPNGRARSSDEISQLIERADN